MITPGNIVLARPNIWEEVLIKTAHWGVRHFITSSRHCQARQRQKPLKMLAPPVAITAILLLEIIFLKNK